MKLTRQEIIWLLRLVERSRDNSKELMDFPSQRYDELQLEYERMSTLAEKLGSVLEPSQPEQNAPRSDKNQETPTKGKRRWPRFEDYTMPLLAIVAELSFMVGLLTILVNKI